MGNFALYFVHSHIQIVRQPDVNVNVREIAIFIHISESGLSSTRIIPMHGITEIDGRLAIVLPSMEATLSADVRNADDWTALWRLRAIRDVGEGLSKVNEKAMPHATAFMLSKLVVVRSCTP